MLHDVQSVPCPLRVPLTPTTSETSVQCSSRRRSRYARQDTSSRQVSQAISASRRGSLTTAMR